MRLRGARRQDGGRERGRRDESRAAPHGADVEPGDLRVGPVQLDLEAALERRAQVEAGRPARRELALDVVAVQVDLARGVGDHGEADALPLAEGQAAHPADGAPPRTRTTGTAGAGAAGAGAVVAPGVVALPGAARSGCEVACGPALAGASPPEPPDRSTRNAAARTATATTATASRAPADSPRAGAGDASGGSLMPSED